MNSAALLLSIGSFIWVMGTVVDYFRKIPQAKVPANPIGLVLALLAGISLAILALAWSYQAGTLGLFVIAPAALAIPTTLLVDEQGVTQWIDQSDDYRIRSNNERVLGAINKVFS